MDKILTENIHISQSFMYGLSKLKNTFIEGKITFEDYVRRDLTLWLRVFKEKLS